MIWASYALMKILFKQQKNLQATLVKVHTLLWTWKVRVNEIKSKLTLFTLCYMTYRTTYGHIKCPPPPVNSVKYIGLHLNTRSMWKKQIISKQKVLEHKLKSGYLVAIHHCHSVTKFSCSPVQNNASYLYGATVFSCGYTGLSGLQILSVE